MDNIVIENVDTGNPILSNTEFEDGLLTLAGAETVKAGTILARDSSTGKFVLFVKGGTTNGNGIPKAVMTYDVASIGAGDISVRPGIKGQYRKQRLVIHADGNATNVDNAVCDQLRDYGLTPVSVHELGSYDNQ